MKRQPFLNQALKSLFVWSWACLWNLNHPNHATDQSLCLKVLHLHMQINIVFSITVAITGFAWPTTCRRVRLLAERRCSASPRPSSFVSAMHVLSDTLHVVQLNLTTWHTICSVSKQAEGLDVIRMPLSLVSTTLSL